MEVIFHVYVWLSPFTVHQKLSWHCLLIGYVLACMLSHFNCVQFCATTWTAACQAPLSKGFSREEYWSRLPCPPSGDLSYPGTRTISYIPIQNKVKKKKGLFFFSADFPAFKFFWCKLSYYLAYFSSLEFPINQMLDLEVQSALGFVFCQEHLIG